MYFKWVIEYRLSVCFLKCSKLEKFIIDLDIVYDKFFFFVKKWYEFMNKNVVILCNFLYIILELKYFRNLYLFIFWCLIIFCFIVVIVVL